MKTDWSLFSNTASTGVYVLASETLPVDELHTFMGYDTFGKLPPPPPKKKKRSVSISDNERIPNPHFTSHKTPFLHALPP